MLMLDCVVNNPFNGYYSAEKKVLQFY